METVSFRRMDEATSEDYELLARYEEAMLSALPERLLEAVEALDESFGGYQVHPQGTLAAVRDAGLPRRP